MRAPYTLYEEQLGCIEKLLGLLKGYVSVDESNYDEVNKQVSEIIDDFVGTWESEYNRDLEEYEEEQLKEVENEFDEMIKELDDAELQEQLKKYHGDLNQYKGQWINEAYDKEYSCISGEDIYDSDFYPFDESLYNFFEYNRYDITSKDEIIELIGDLNEINEYLSNRSKNN